MNVPILTFQDIISLNDNDWDRAYDVLTYHLEKGNIFKEITLTGQVIYHNPTRVQSHNLIHDKIFFSKSKGVKRIMRPRQKRINQEGNDGADNTIER